MAKSKLNIENSALTWDANRRYKVNSVLTHIGRTYQNLTGKNSEPGVGPDWFIAESNLEAVTDRGNSTPNDIIFVADAKVVFDDGIFKTTLNRSTLTANRAIEFQDGDGVVAFLSDIVSSETTTTLGALIGSAADATPNDSDFIATSLTAGGILKKITWTNAKAFLKTYFDTIYTTTSAVATQISTALSSYLTSATADSTYETITNVALKVDKNTAITGATKTKITYDAKGLVTSGADATTADIASSTDKRYLTDAQLAALHPQETATTIATINHAATAKTTLVDADEVTGQNSATSFSLIRTVWSDVWTYIKSKADSIYQATLVSGTNIKTINSTSILGSGDITVSGGASLSAANTWSGVQTFLSGMFGLRNVANTFTSFFSSTATAARTYTLQDRNGTLADLTDIATKMSNPSGTVNYLSKFLTTTTIGISRLWDTGTFFGIGTENTPTKDITLGNQTDREVGIEESSNTVAGASLSIKAGRTINFVANTNFNVLTGQPALAWSSGCGAPNGNVYLGANNGDIYMQTAGTGVFTVVSGTNRNWFAMCATSGNNIYGAVPSGDIYMQTAGSGAFNALSQTSRAWDGLAAASNGNVYAAVFGGDIYMQTAGTGNFVAIGGTSRNWRSLCANGNDIYGFVNGGDIYKQTGGTGAFVALSQTVRGWWGSTAIGGNIYALGDGDVYVQTGGTGNFVLQSGQTGKGDRVMASIPSGNIYAASSAGVITMQQNNGTGSSNLNGGILKLAAGTGKGTGISKIQLSTGAKAASGTDMQVETVRMEINELGVVEVFAPVKLKVYTVTTLPTATTGETAVVSDALAPTYMTTIVGGGAVVTPVFYNGTNWVAN